MYGYDTEQMSWDEIPEDIKDWLCDNTDFIEWVEKYDQPELELEGGL